MTSKTTGTYKYARIYDEEILSSGDEVLFQKTGDQIVINVSCNHENPAQKARDIADLLSELRKVCITPNEDEL